MFKKVLIANRGAIACRIIRTLRQMGVGSVAVYSEADADSLHVAMADEAICLGAPQAAQSYLSFDKIFDAARRTGAQAIHPGYGFLSENAEFAEACAREGIVFIGPQPEHLRAFGLKHTARALAEQHQVPLLPGTGLLADVEEAQREAERVGLPVMLKSTAGGGGIGMRLCRSQAELEDAFAAVARLGSTHFKDSGIYLERFVEQARHVEVQVFGDGEGTVLALGERDCSAQRRNQKVIEETPAPGISEETRQQLMSSAVRLLEPVQYESAGTVEFLLDGATGEFYFLEVNTRLQVEHGVTEEVTGIDLVAWMVRQAAGNMQPLATVPVRAHGASIQVRLYAEDPQREFRPSSGQLSQVQWPADTRVETWVETGVTVPPYYDPLLAKVITYGSTREEALAKLQAALEETRLYGIETNLAYLRHIIADPVFQAGRITTQFLRSFRPASNTVEVIEAGTQTTVQDWPGRLGYWDVGVPPSGPMDSLAFRLANRLVGNADSAAGLEITMMGPTLRFHSEAVIALTGADMNARLDDAPLPPWQVVFVAAGSVLHMDAAREAGSRAYLAVRGGLAVPDYLGSKSTFILGRFGGHAGRTLRPGDVLHLASDTAPTGAATLNPLALAVRPHYSPEWEIGVLYGPHGAPDFFQPEGITEFLQASWRVHHQSDRTGTRLLGPKPLWARPDGGEAGLHPSNIHDNAYAIGAVDFTGDLPVVLGPDGPSLGGFVCPVVIVQAELWKVGQLRPGDTVRFRLLTLEQAQEMESAVEEAIATLDSPLPLLPHSPELATLSPVVKQMEPSSDAAPDAPAVVCRAAGDKYLLVEYGPNVLDLDLRFRVQALTEWMKRQQVPGVIDLTPGIRSLQIHYENRQLSRDALLETLEAAEAELGNLEDVAVPTRTVHMPLSWDDPATRLAIEKYTQSVRPDAPWAPSNIEFIRRINGLASEEDVRHIVYNASYLVLGLGDVYLGAPVATPVDPRHRLVTTKYNPARTWTPENAVGIGGAYLCIYGMEGPGGYQFVGRTLQTWNSHRVTREFQQDKPWLLRFFDQIRFYPVSADELLAMREAFPRGQTQLEIQEDTFRLREYHQFLAGIQNEAASFKAQQQAAFQEERERWAAAGHVERADEIVAAPPSNEGALPEGALALRSPITASVWQVLVEPGQLVEAGDKLIILEAMKMEVALTAPVAGEVAAVLCTRGALVNAGQTLAAVRPLAGGAA